MKKAGKTRVSFVLAISMAALAAAGCSTAPAGRKTTGPSVVPAPLRLEARPGAFALGPSTRIVIPESQAGLLPVASALKDMLRSPTGYDLGIDVSTALAGEVPVRAGSILLRLEDLEGRLGKEGYLLDVSTDGILIRGAAPAGLFYGVQTLRQLLPAAIEGPGGNAGTPSWTVPCVSIEDKPRFSWRGALLDCSRHFFPKEFVKRWIDILARHKMNTFHWHLTDDQGWRIEIKRYPKLTEIGAWRVDREDQHWNAREAAAAGRGRDLRRFLHPGRHPRDRRLCRGPLRDDRARDRDARRTPRGPWRPIPNSRAPADPSPLPRAESGRSRTSSVPARTARSSSWKTSWPRSWISSRAPSSTSAATRPTRPSGSAAPSARPG